MAQVRFSILSTRQDLLLVSIHYQYTKHNPKRDLRFTIKRKRPAGTDNEIQAITYYEHECYFTLDESSIKAFPDAALYSVSELIIDNRYRLPLTQVNPTDNEYITYHAEIPQNVPLNETATISYHICFPMELESMLAINIEIPTHKMTMELDYSELKDSIEIASQSLISRKFGPNPVNNRNGVGKPIWF